MGTGGRRAVSGGGVEPVSGLSSGKGALSIASFSTLMLELHEASDVLDAEEFRHFLLTTLDRHIGFDSAWTGRASTGPDGHKAHASNLYQQPDEFVDFWQSICHEDVLSHQVLRCPGTLAQFNRWGGSSESEGLVELCKHFDIGDIICLSAASVAVTGFERAPNAFISLYRDSGRRSFSSTEKHFLLHLFPHLERLLKYAYCKERKESAASALYDRFGICYDMASRYAPLIVQERAGFGSGQLHPDVQQQLFQRPSRTWCGENIRLVASPLRDMWLVEACLLGTLGALSQREKDVARSYAGGATYREIARLHGVAPSTVRNQIQSVYRKLKVSGKIELANRMCR